MFNLSNNKEKFLWIFQRITGFQLFICIVVHIWVFSFKLERPIDHLDLYGLFSHPEWVIFYSIFILLGIYHGFSGLWTILTDRDRSTTFKKTMKIIFIVTALIIYILATCNLVLLGAS